MSEATETRFLANMSHEIRTPMNAIMGFIELVLADNNLPKEHRDHLSIALKSSKHLLKLINNILDLSKIESNQIHIKPTIFELASLLDIIKNHWKKIANEKGLIFDIEIKKSLDITVKSDKIILEKAISLLIDNAIKFTDKGEVKVTISQSPMDNSIAITIADTGIGIHPTFVKNVFTSFKQGENANNRNFDGVGLGATIAYKLIHLLNGEIVIDSEYGVGTTITILVPIQIIKNNIDSNTNPNKNLSDRLFSILLVDDIEPNLELGKAFLSHYGHAVITAKNGIEAIEQWQTNSVDIILMDIHMPIMGGIDAVKKIRERENGNNRHQIIIAVTADSMSDVKSELLALGFDDVVGKPIDYKALLNLLTMTLPNEYGVISSKSEEKNSEEKNSVDTITQLHKTDIDMIQLLDNLINSLEQYNPNKVEPYIDELEEHLGTNNIISLLRTLIDKFDFTTAIVEVERLKDRVKKGEE